MTGIFSTTDVDNQSSLDFDATSRNSVVNYVDEESDQTSTEIRFNYNGDRFNWVGGIYLLDDDIYRNDNFASNIESTFGIVQIMQMMAGMTPVASDNTQTSNANVTSEAIYWQGTYAVNDKLNATLGVRKSDDESDYSIAVGTTSPGIPFVQVPGQWSILTFGQIQSLYWITHLTIIQWHIFHLHLAIKVEDSHLQHGLNLNQEVVLLKKN